jgi:hypothetical protein
VSVFERVIALSIEMDASVLSVGSDAPGAQTRISGPSSFLRITGWLDGVADATLGRRALAEGARRFE